MERSKCDVCGRPAKHHVTSLQGKVVSEQHLCGIHGNRSWFASFKEVLVGQVDDLPTEWLPEGVPRDQWKKRISEARTLSEVRAAFKPS